MSDHEPRITLSLLLLALLFSPACAQNSLCGDGTRSQLAFTPTRMVLNRNRRSQSVTITCQYPSVSSSGLTRHSLALSRTQFTSARSTQMLLANENGNKKNSGFSGATFKGTYNTAFNFTLPQASCDDALYVYTCEAVSNTVGSTTSSVSCLNTGRLEVVSEPTDVRLQAEPSDSAHSVGETLTLTCSATVGLKKETNRASWMWEMKKAGGSWTTLKNNVHLNKLMLNKCLWIRYTIFKINLRSSHKGNSYRCYLVKEGKTYTSSAKVYTVQVDSFIFGLKTSHGSVVLVGIFIILLALGAAVFVGVRHFMRYTINKERNMYRERVMNRLDKLFRFEEELIGGVMNKRKSLVPVEEPKALEPPPPPPPKKRLEEEVAEQTEVTIHLQMPNIPEPEEPEPEPEAESVASPEPSEVDSDVGSESTYFDDPTGPMHKV